MIEAALLLTSILAISSTQSQPANRDLDFWVGSWNVYVDNTLVGHDVVEKSLDGFVIIERWDGGGDDKGTSFFYYMPAKKQWKQVWATNVGAYKEKFSEPFKDGIRFAGNVFLPSGKSIPDRTTLTALPDGTVRQVIEQARDGKTWKTGFDAIYRRVK